MDCISSIFSFLSFIKCENNSVRSTVSQSLLYPASGMELMLVVLLSSLTVVDAPESDVIGSREPVKETVGDDAILPCHLKPPFDVNNLTVEWTRNGKEVHVYRSRKDDLIHQDKNFKDRTSLFHDEMTRGNISLKLTNVTELDAGSYTCYVPKLESQVMSGNVILIVEPVKKSNNASQTNDKSRDIGLGIGAIIFVIAIVIVIAIAIWKTRGGISMCAGRDERGNNGQYVVARQDNPVEIPLQ